MTLLSVDAVVKSFAGVVALDNVSFAIDEGELVGIMGANGAGKTTLFSVIAGNLRANDGAIRFDGRRIDGLRPDQISQRGIARTFQIVRPFGNMTVLENVTLGVLFGRRRERSAAAAAAKAKEIIDRLGLSERADLLAKHLTLAGRKRLEIARSLATEPRLLLLDEVLAGLTPTEAAAAAAIVRDVHASERLTILMIEHVTRALMALSQRIIVLHHGQKIAEGTPSEVARDPRTVSVYLGTASQ
ncbi:MAG: ABC transporter ATP-binding protein [Xanthobacteraceae bacterium]